MLLMFKIHFSIAYTIEDNEDLGVKLANKSMPTKEIISVAIGGGFGNVCCVLFIKGEK